MAWSELEKKYPKIKEGNEMHHSCLWELCNYSKSLMSYDFLVSPTFFEYWTINVEHRHLVIYIVPHILMRAMGIIRKRPIVSFCLNL